MNTLEQQQSVLFVVKSVWHNVMIGFNEWRHMCWWHENWVGQEICWWNMKTLRIDETSTNVLIDDEKQKKNEGLKKYTNDTNDEKAAE